MTHTPPPLRLVPPLNPFHTTEPNIDDLRQGTWDKPNTFATNDARDLPLPTGSAALAITAPPTLADHEPDTTAPYPERWETYLTFLRDSLSELWRVLEAGGRLALVIDPNPGVGHVAIEQSVTALLQHQGFIIRGNIVWAKALKPHPLNPGVLRGPQDPPIVGVTERIIMASKLTSARRYTPRERRDLDLPSTNTISVDQWAASRLDFWHLPMEEPTPYSHEFGFPVELATRLIETHTYEGELVIDPMCGTGTTALAAHSLRRRFYASDSDAKQVRIARKRLSHHTGQNVAQSTKRHPANPNPSTFTQPTLDLTGDQP